MAAAAIRRQPASPSITAILAVLRLPASLPGRLRRVVFSFNNAASRARYNYAWAALDARRTGRTRAAPPGMCESLGHSPRRSASSPRSSRRCSARMIAFALVRLPVPGPRGDATCSSSCRWPRPRSCMGSSLLTAVPQPVGLPARLQDDRHRAHHVLHQLRRRHGQGAGASLDPRARGGRRRTSTPAPAQTFLRVTFPLVLPGIVGRRRCWRSRCSFDDFIITNFNAGPSIDVPEFV